MPGDVSTLWWWFLVLGVTAGVVSGSLGIGSGIVLVPALVLFFAFGQKAAQPHPRKERRPMTGRSSGDGLVRVFSARACAAPLERAAALFEQETGTRVAISVCSRHCAEPVAERARACYEDFGWRVPSRQEMAR